MRAASRGRPLDIIIKAAAVMTSRFFPMRKPAIKWDGMRYVSLGQSGLKVSPICLGAMAFGSPQWQQWTIGEEASRRVVSRALELGINFFDTADVYSNGLSEVILGKALKEFADRSQVVIATKVSGPMGPGPNQRGLSRSHILDAVEASLKRLQTDYLDLYYVHRWDYETPIEETLEALNDLVRSGKVRYLGASSMFAWEFACALHLQEQNHWSRFVAMQNHYNLLYREEEREMIPLCRHYGVAVLPWSPLARGVLTGNRKLSKSDGYRGARATAPGFEAQSLRAKTDEYSLRLYCWEEDYLVAECCLEIARSRGVPASHVALAWLLKNPAVSAPVLGPSRVEHIEEAVGALAFRLDEAEIRALEEVYVPHPVLGHEGRSK
jgi:aryl-alcohol dehydrogenase-like predicted oxidoreductase